MFTLAFPSVSGGVGFGLCALGRSSIVFCFSLANISSVRPAAGLEASQLSALGWMNAHAKCIRSMPLGIFSIIRSDQGHLHVAALVLMLYIVPCMVPWYSSLVIDYMFSTEWYTTEFIMQVSVLSLHAKRVYTTALFVPNSLFSYHLQMFFFWRFSKQRIVTNTLTGSMHISHTYTHNKWQ